MTTTKCSSNHSIIVRHRSNVRCKEFHGNAWGLRHENAWITPSHGSEAMIKALITGWADYADEYHRASNFEPHETLSQDGYAGAYWLKIGQSIIKLLSMDIGRFDGGTLDQLIRDIAKNEGFDPDEL